MCPNCGYLVLLDSSILNNSIKKEAENKNNIDPYLFRKNNVLSELINLEMQSKKISGPIRKRVINF